jgi:hypothetical protein
MRAFVLVFHKSLGSILDLTPTSISTIMSHMGPCSCRGVRSNSMRINSKHICSPI